MNTAETRPSLAYEKNDIDITEKAMAAHRNLTGRVLTNSHDGLRSSSCSTANVGVD